MRDLRCGLTRRNGSSGSVSPTGHGIFVRPLRPEDEPLLRRLFEKITAEDLRLRFFAPIKTFSHAFLARLTQLDYARAIAFAAIAEASGEWLGVVWLHADANYETGEYAIMVRSDLKGRGLGWKLMELMIRYARSEGLKRIVGQVLQENSTMLQMCRELGFQIAIDPQRRHDPNGVVAASIADYRYRGAKRSSLQTIRRERAAPRSVRPPNCFTFGITMSKGRRNFDLPQ